MLKRNMKLIHLLDMLTDTILVVAAYILASAIWLVWISGNPGNMAFWQDTNVLTAAVLYALIYWMLLALMGLYNSNRTIRLRYKAVMIFSAGTVTILVASVFLYFFRLQEFSRGVFLLFYAGSMLLVFCKHFLRQWLVYQLRSRGYNIKRILIIGTGDSAVQCARDLCRDSRLGYRVEGFIGLYREDLPYPYFGDFSRLDDILHYNDIDETVIAPSMEESSLTRDLILGCERNGIRYSIIPSYSDILPRDISLEVVGSSRMISLRRNRLDNIGWASIKRLFDILASGIGMIVISPLLLILAVGVKLSSPGPVIFRQKRIGFNRHPFIMLKYRSMRVNDESTTAWTTNADSRKTRFGSFIRKFSLDELPQLWNVFTGSMSLVGPRPELPKFVEQFRDKIPLYMVKHQVRPGMTGWAQVNGFRGDTSIEKRIEHDIWYIEHWSPWLDLKILFLTVFGGMINRETLFSAKDSAKHEAADTKV